jgi:transcriptional regulator with XRE-family HTH domain
MNLKQQRSAEFVIDVIGKSLIPRNQIANISGLTNTYIRDLEQGNIANVSRDKLLKFSTAVGLNLGAIDELLTVFDRSKLNADDIPIFIENAKQQKLSNSVHTARDFFGYELMLLATESLSGSKTLNTNHPTAILQPEGLRSYLSRNNPRHHPIHNELSEAIGKERKRNLIEQLNKYDMYHYISKHALENYFLACKDPVERSWKAQHLLTIRDFIQKYPRFKCYMTDVETGFNCLLKHSDNNQTAERIFFYSHDLSLMQGQLSGQLIGFYTGNKVIIEQFKKDIDIIKARILDQYQDTASLEKFITELVHRSDIS